MKDREPTVRSRELGVGLRRVMEDAGYNGTEIAEMLGWSQGRVSRLLSGKRGGTGIDVSAFLAVCRTKGAERDRLMALSGDHTRPGWWLQHCPTLPTGARTLVDLEANAATITEFQPTLLPALLHTPDYARAVLSRSATVPPEDIDGRIDALLARQAVLNPPRAPRCMFYLHEYALRLPIGGPAVMAEQLLDLLRVASLLNVTLRVLPAHRGAHAGLAGPFTLIEVRDLTSIVYLETETSSLFLETPHEVTAYQNILAALNTTALDENSSRELINQEFHTAATEATTKRSTDPSGGHHLLNRRGELKTEQAQQMDKTVRGQPPDWPQ